MIVCIAEKPSVARDIATILGANDSHISKGIGYFQGNGYQVTWTFGHLCTLKEPHDYYELWKKWDISTLPIIPQKFSIKPINNDHFIAQMNLIQSLVKNATMIINCGDAGQEGELIQRWVLQYVECRCPVKRLWISSLTEEAIKNGFSNLKDSSVYDTLYFAGMARAIGDWLLGINATRLYTIMYGNKENVISIGRVQTPTLALVVERDYEIANFQPINFWEIKTLFKGIVFSLIKGKIKSREKADIILSSILNKNFVIGDIKKKNGKESPPLLFDLTGLQVICNKKFGFSAEETLKIAQTLYEKKLITYPRVDTTYLSDDIYSKSINILSGLKEYQDLILPLLKRNNTLLKRKKVFNNTKITDHHAIIPTGQTFNINNLNKKEKIIFDLICRHFIAIFYPDCEFSITTIVGSVDKFKFKAAGKELIHIGWKFIFQKEKKNISEENDEEINLDDNILSFFTIGESGTHFPQIKEGTTKPPKHYTEATLLRAMETAGKFINDEKLREALKGNGIGRPSTRANIIETLYKRKYIEKDGRYLRSTEFGKNLVSIIKFELLKSAELTGEWENKLRMIERNELNVSIFISELKLMVSKLIHSVTNHNQDNKNYSIKCPMCNQGYLIRGNQAWGCSGYSKGCRFIIPFKECPSSISQKELEIIVAEKYFVIMNELCLNKIIN